VLADYDFSDGSGSKLRPVLVLFREQQDYTVLKMTTQAVTWNDVLVITPSSLNNLKMVTRIRMKKINTFHEVLFLPKKLWCIDEKEKQQIKKYLQNFLGSL